MRPDLAPGCNQVVIRFLVRGLQSVFDYDNEEDNDDEWTGPSYSVGLFLSNATIEEAC